MSIIPFSNAETRAIFFDVLTDWLDQFGDLSIAREWLEMGSGDAGEMLAKQLRKDAYKSYSSFEQGDPTRALVRAGLARVNWRQLANRLLSFCRPAESPEARTESGEEPAA